MVLLILSRNVDLMLLKIRHKNQRVNGNNLPGKKLAKRQVFINQKSSKVAESKIIVMSNINNI